MALSQDRDLSSPQRGTTEMRSVSEPSFIQRIYFKILHLLLLSLQLFVNSLPQKGRYSSFCRHAGIPTCTEIREGGGDVFKLTDWEGEQERHRVPIQIVVWYNDSPLLVFSPFSGRDTFKFSFSAKKTAILRVDIFGNARKKKRILFMRPKFEVVFLTSVLEQEVKSQHWWIICGSGMNTNA